MGANAQTTVPTFTASQVLTAAQQNQSARTGVPVFASTVTRDAAFGGTGEKTLDEGQLCYVEGTGLQTYNGTSWVTWGTAPATGGFVVVKTETAFTTSSSVTIDNIFSATYRNYKIVVNYISSSTAGARVRLRVGGVTTSTATYNEQSFIGDNATASASRGSSATSITVGINTNGTFNSSFELFVGNPFVATPTTFMSTNIASNAAYTAPIAALLVGNQSGSTSFDGVEFFPSSGTLTGNYTVYGLATA